MFQFLMVQLKDKILTNPTIGPLLFQFLMVQLKEYGRSTNNLSYAVSIPYGTIKRLIQAVRGGPHHGFNSLWYN